MRSGWGLYPCLWECIRCAAGDKHGQTRDKHVTRQRDIPVRRLKTVFRQCTERSLSIQGGELVSAGNRLKCEMD